MSNNSIRPFAQGCDIFRFDTTNPIEFPKLFVNRRNREDLITNRGTRFSPKRRTNFKGRDKV